jgi:multicomponent Na+:H+ antiporter subunit E
MKSRASAIGRTRAVPGSGGNSSTLAKAASAAAPMPGTLPAGSDQSGALIYHCLDVDQPVAQQLKQEETLLVAALGGTLGSTA